MKAVLGFALGVVLALSAGAARRGPQGTFQVAATTDQQGYVVVVLLNTQTGRTFIRRVGNLKIPQATQEDVSKLVDGLGGL